LLELSRLLWMVVFVGVLVAVSNDRAEAKTRLASWYGPGFAGAPTANGDVFDPNAFTAAHKTLPFGTQLTVSYRGRSAQVTVNDRGPYTGGRDLDLSQGAAEYLGLTRAGVDYVDYTVTGRGGYGARQAAHAARQPDTLLVDRPLIRGLIRGLTRGTTGPTGRSTGMPGGGMPPLGLTLAGGPTTWCVQGTLCGGSRRNSVPPCTSSPPPTA
jgi:hypothetical protein